MRRPHLTSHNALQGHVSQRQAFYTHPWPHGAEVLDRWGLLSALEATGFKRMETREEVAMYVIREILNCKPGKVRQVVESFRTISTALEEMGRPPFRLLTDVTREPFWTLVAESTVETVDEFFEMERAVMAKESVRKGTADFNDLIQGGRREIYRVEG